jgi:hypothetical protein
LAAAAASWRGATAEIGKQAHAQLPERFLFSHSLSIGKNAFNVRDISNLIDWT